MTQRIFLSPPHLGGHELEALARALESGYIAPVGPDIDGFERDLAAYLGAGRCVALNSGTAAIHLALELAGVGPGDAVLCSDLTFIASVGPVRSLGAEPIFLDASPATWNLDPDLLAACLDAWPKERALPKALVLVHLYGAPADLDPVAALCAERGIVLIEDAAESLGATYKGKPTGALSRFGILSFNGNKIITASGGGMLVCQREQDAQEALYLATQARDPSAHYEHSRIGYSYRPSNLLAALGRAQFRLLPERVSQKRALRAAYQERLGDLACVSFMPEPAQGRSNHWLTCVTFAQPHEPQGQALREKARLALTEANIEARPVWKPMHMQPVFRGCQAIGGAVGRDLFQRGLCLPSGTQLTMDDLDRICDIVRNTLT